MKKIKLLDLGLKDYKETWDDQEVLFQNTINLKIENRKNSTNYLTPNYFLFVEHPHVYTIGKSGQESNMLANLTKLKEIDALYVKTNRGGDITYHGPQQLVAYPILDLFNFKEDVNWYMRSLEEVIIRTIAHYGLQGVRSPGETGVWLDVGKPYARKICAMGVKASRWVTMHGLAFNVNTDLRYFEYIVPCGIKDKNVTSLQRELDRNVNMEEVKELVFKNFAEVLEAEIIPFQN